MCIWQRKEWKTQEIDENDHGEDKFYPNRVVFPINMWQNNDTTIIGTMGL